MTFTFRKNSVVFSSLFYLFPRIFQDPPGIFFKKIFHFVTIVIPFSVT